MSFDIVDLNLHYRQRKERFEDNYPYQLFEVEKSNGWFENPAGIWKCSFELPRFLKIKADVLEEEMETSKTGTLHDLLTYMCLMMFVRALTIIRRL